MEDTVTSQIEAFWQWLNQVQVVPYEQRDRDHEDYDKMVSEHDIVDKLRKVIDTLHKSIRGADLNDTATITKLLDTTLVFSESFVTSNWVTVCSQEGAPDWSKNIVADELMQTWEYLYQRIKLSDATIQSLITISNEHFRENYRFQWCVRGAAKYYADKKQDVLAVTYFNAWPDISGAGGEHDVIIWAQCLVRQEEFEEAAKLLEKAAELHPTSARLHSDLGFCLYRSKQNRKADKALRQVIEIEENRKFHNYNYYKYALDLRANCSLRQADAWRALFQFNQLLSIPSAKAQQIAKEKVPLVLGFIKPPKGND